MWFVGHGPADRHRGHLLGGGDRLVGGKPSVRVKDRLNEHGDLGASDGVVADVRRDDLGGQREELAPLDLLIRHCRSFARVLGRRTRVLATGSNAGKSPN